MYCLVQQEYRSVLHVRVSAFVVDDEGKRFRLAPLPLRADFGVFFCCVRCAATAAAVAADTGEGLGDSLRGFLESGSRILDGFKNTSRCRSTGGTGG